MPSQAFINFKAEFQATGAEKLNGYTLSNFDSLTTDERDEAFRLLSLELRDYHGAARALVRLDQEKGVNAIKEVLARMSPTEYSRAYELLFALWQVTGNQKWVDAIISSGWQLAGTHRLMVLQILSNIPASTSILDFLKKILLGETEMDAVGAAAKQLLDRHGLKRVAQQAQPDRRRYWSLLTGASRSERLAAVRALEAEFPKVS